MSPLDPHSPATFATALDQRAAQLSSPPKPSPPPSFSLDKTIALLNKLANRHKTFPWRQLVPSDFFAKLATFITRYNHFETTVTQATQHTITLQAELDSIKTVLAASQQQQQILAAAALTLSQRLTQLSPPQPDRLPNPS